MRYPLAQQATSMTKLRASHLAAGVVTAAALFLFMGLGARLVANLVGFLYPLWESFHALRRKPAPGVRDEEDSLWLTYWVTYSAFTLVESMGDLILQFIPAYHLVKILFLVWCMAPQTRGALWIYHTIIEPLFARFEGDIDRAGVRVQAGAAVLTRELGEAGSAAVAHKRQQVVDAALNALAGDQPQFSPPGGAAEHDKDM